MAGYLLDNAQLDRDESGNLRSLTFDDIYHSSAGGTAEKEHVFLKQHDLESRWQHLGSDHRTHFTIVETGFGLGLNFFLTAQLWLNTAPANAVLYYRAIEKHPIVINELQNSLAAFAIDHQLANNLLERYPHPIRGIHRLWLQPGICLDLIYEDIVDGLVHLQSGVDAWYLDGFSPAKNADMWADKLWPMIARVSNPGATLSTYSVAGSVRRGLSQAGFEVSRQQGFGNKRELLKARFKAPDYPAPSAGRPVQVAVIGGGLAGTTCAHQLLRRNVKVTLIESSRELAQGASSMYQLAYYPQLASAYDPYCSFSLQAYLYLHDYLGSLQDSPLIGQSTGLIRLMAQEKSQQLVAQFDQCPEIVEEISAREASRLAGVTLAGGGIHFRGGGWLDPNALIRAQCEGYSSSGQLTIRQDSTITAITRSEVGWQLQDQFATEVGEFSAVILANGIQARDFQQLSTLPLAPVRGQAAILQCNPDQDVPGVVLAGRIGVFPGLGNRQGVSATYQHDCDDLAIRPEEATWLLHEARALLSEESLQAVQNRVGIRCVTRDRHPVAGPIPDWQKLKEHYAPLARNARAEIAAFTHSQEGLYVCTGFGSHGVTHIPLCADYLASLICAEPDPLTLETRGVLDPARFMIRDMKKQLS